MDSKNHARLTLTKLALLALARAKSPPAPVNAQRASAAISNCEPYSCIVRNWTHDTPKDFSVEVRQRCIDSKSIVFKYSFAFSFHSDSLSGIIRFSLLQMCLLNHKYSHWAADSKKDHCSRGIIRKQIIEHDRIPTGRPLCRAPFLHDVLKVAFSTEKTKSTY